MIASDLAILFGTGVRNFQPFVGSYYNAAATGGALVCTDKSHATITLDSTMRVLVTAFHFHLGTAGIGGIYFDSTTDVYICRGSFAANGGVALEGLWVGDPAGVPTAVTDTSGNVAAHMCGYVQRGL